MTAKKDACKKTMTARKQWLERTVTAKSSFGRKARTNALFSQLQLAVFEGSLAPERHIQNFACSVEGSFTRELRTTLICRFVRKSRTKASFSHLQLAARCAAPQTRALPANRGTNPCVFILPNSKLYFLFYDLSYDLFPLPNSEYVCFYSQSGFAQSIFHNFNLQCLKEVWHQNVIFKLQHLARKLRSHNFNLQCLKEVWHQSVIFKTSACSA